MKVHDRRAPLEPLIMGASLVLLFATSFTNPLVIVTLAAIVLITGFVLLPHLRQHGLIAAALAFLAAVLLVRLAYSFA